MAERLVYLTKRVEVSDDAHCSNNCAFISNDSERCLLFSGELAWDKRRRANGRRRLQECLDAEETDRLTDEQLRYVWRILGPLQALTFGHDLFVDKTVVWAWFDLLFFLNGALLTIDAWVGSYRGDS